MPFGYYNYELFSDTFLSLVIAPLQNVYSYTYKV